MSSMTLKEPRSFFTKDTKSKGEPYVWFTGMGLVLGIFMIVSLLTLIFVKGFEVFWPDRVMLAELREGSPGAAGASRFLAGSIVMRQEKPVRDLTAPHDADTTELQLFVGNKDVYGFAYRFVDSSDILGRTYPQELMRIERLEYGDAMGKAAGLRVKGQAYLPASDPAFRASLERLVHDAEKRWKEIRRIEKSEIGRINRTMEKIRLKKKSLQASGEADVSERAAALDAQSSELQEKYEGLAREAARLRSMQKDSALDYETYTGEKKSLPAGEIVGFYYPNELYLPQRIAFLIGKIISFLTAEPREANTEGGVFPAIFGTFVMTVMMSVAVTPFGVLAAIYLREYAKQGFMVRAVRIAVNNLAGVPSIVFGVFGVGFFVYFVGASIDQLFFKEALPTPTFGTGGVLWASLTLALLTVPVVIVATEEALAAVPRGMREGSLACGASKWETIARIVLPASAPGILTGLILAMARGASEVAPLMLVGVVKLAPSLPIDGEAPFFHFERKFMHLGYHIYDLGFQSPDSEAAKPMVFATTLLLITLVVVLNLGAIFIREKLRKKYATGAF